MEETKYRLRELKQVLLYPVNTKPISSTLQKIINENVEKPKKQKAIYQFIEFNQVDLEEEKTKLILEHIEKILRIKKLMSD
jgi:hypothetical protein